MIASGTINDCTWSIDDEGYFLLEPTDGDSGSIDIEWSTYTDVPWYEYRENIITAEVKNIAASGRLYYMFYSCTKMTDLIFTNFDTSGVTAMNRMFYYCSNLTSLDLSSFDTSGVTSMNYMFYGCSNFTSLDLSNFDTSNVITMNGMFTYCSNLTSLDLSSFDTSSVTAMSSIFRYNGLQSITFGENFYLPTSSIYLIDTDNYATDIEDGTAVVFINTDTDVAITTDDDFYSLDMADRAGTWEYTAATNALYNLTGTRSTDTVADSGGDDLYFSVSYQNITDDTTTLNLYSRTANTDYDEAIYTAELEDETGTVTDVVSGVDTCVFYIKATLTGDFNTVETDEICINPKMTELISVDTEGNLYSNNLTATVGDTISFTGNAIFYGHITTSSTMVVTAIPLPVVVNTDEVTDVSLSYGTWDMRGISGYLKGASSTSLSSQADFSNIDSWSIYSFNPSLLVLRFDYSTYSNTTNNTPVTMRFSNLVITLE